MLTIYFLTKFKLFSARADEMEGRTVKGNAVNIENSISKYNGGGLFVRSFNYLRILGCHFINNIAQNGGAVYI